MPSRRLDPSIPSETSTFEKVMKFSNYEAGGMRAHAQEHSEELTLSVKK
jgi:hypothetical protein